MNEPTPELVKVALDLAEPLERHRLNYCLIGGLAAGYRTQPRFTRDLDFLLSVPQLTLPALLDELAAQGFTFDLAETIREWTQHHMAVLSYRGLRVDWLKPVLPAYQHVLDRATVETWLGRPIRVASAEGLILLKLLAARLQDWLDVENLIAAQGDRLDWEWLRTEWRTLADDHDPRMVRFRELAGLPA